MSEGFSEDLDASATADLDPADAAENVTGGSFKPRGTNDGGPGGDPSAGGGAPSDGGGAPSDGGGGASAGGGGAPSDGGGGGWG